MSAGVPEELRRLARELDATASVGGYSAHVLSGLLKPKVCERVSEQLPAGWPRDEFLETVAAIRHAGRVWISDTGSLERKSSEAGAESDVMTTTETAEALCLCPRRVLQLRAAGELAGTKRAGRWSFDRAVVDHYRTQKRGD